MSEKKCGDCVCADLDVFCKLTCKYDKDNYFYVSPNDNCYYEERVKNLQEKIELLSKLP